MNRNTFARKSPPRPILKRRHPKNREPRGKIEPKSTIPTKDRIRDPYYLKWVRTLNCIACNAAAPSQAHHLTHTQPKLKGVKSSDHLTLPLCAACHQIGRNSLHSAESEAVWWDVLEIDAIALCGLLRGLYEAI